MWIVDGASIEYQVKVIAQADSLEDVLKEGINPAHLKKLRVIDAISFLGVTTEARKLSQIPSRTWNLAGAYSTLLRLLDFSSEQRSDPF